MNRNDSLLEQNFDHIGRRVSLPNDPTPDQVMRWTGEAIPAHQHSHWRIRTMSRWILLTGGFGVAAAIAFMSTALVQSPRVARAAQVFADARGAIERTRLARIEFRDVHWKQYSLNLVAHVVLGERGEVESARLDFDNQSVPFGLDEPDFSIQWDMEGTRYQNTFVTSPAGTWTFLKLAEPSADFNRLSPDAAKLGPFVQAARDGVYVERQKRLGGRAVYFTANLNMLALADRQKFSNLVRLVEEKSGVVDVSEPAPGKTLLKASDYRGRTGEVFQAFTWQGRQDDLIDQVFERATFEIASGEGGIERIRLANVGDGGEIVVSFDERVTDFAPNQLDRAFEEQRRPGQLFSTESLRSMKPGGRKE